MCDASIIKANIQVVAALRIRSAVAGADVVLTLACGNAHVIDAAAVRKLFGFVGGIESGGRLLVIIFTFSCKAPHSSL